MPSSSSPQKTAKSLHSVESSVPTHVAILGAAGRMSGAVMELFSQTSQADRANPQLGVQPPIKVVAGIEHETRLGQGRAHAATTDQAHSKPIPFVQSLSEAVNLTTETADHGLDALIDFSHPEATLSHLRAHLRHPEKYGFRAWVIGTTGFTPEQEAELERASQEIALLRSGNFSKGIFTLLALLKEVAGLMGETCDYEIIETHHRDKKDAPSGTAKMLANALVNALDPADPSSSQEKPSPHDNTHPDNGNKRSIHYGRAATNTLRQPKEIGVASLRGGGVIGDHDIHILSDHEKLVLSHHAFDRLAFASGIPAAVHFVVQQARAQKYGLYSLQDALGGIFETLDNKAK